MCVDEKLTAMLTDFIGTVAVYLSDDVEKRVKELAAAEKGEVGKQMYGCILENIRLSHTLKRPLCQDTGVLQFFVKAGCDFPYLSAVEESIRAATVNATVRTPLRPNAVKPFSESNTGDNTGFGAPYISWEIVKGDSLEIGLYLAGGGCSLPGRSEVLMPLEGIDGIKQFVYRTVLDWGVNACPPLFVGVGVGTCAVTAAELSKKALLREIGTTCPDEKGAALEKELTEGLNSLGIAPMGFGGDNSVLAVNLECAAHHPATLGVGISTGCWATRRGKILIDSDLNYTIPTHTHCLKEN